MILILVSSLLYLAAFPKLNLFFFAFIALIPFFYQIEKYTSYKKKFLGGFIWGILIALGQSYFLFYTISVEYDKSILIAVFFIAVCVLIPIGLLYGIFSLLYGFVQKKGLFFYGFIIPSLWTIIEYTKEIIPIFIPWGGIAYSLTPFLSFIQIADTVGYYGLIFLVVMINGILFYIIIDDITIFRFKSFIDSAQRLFENIWGTKKISLFLVSALFIIPVIYGIIQLQRYENLNHPGENPDHKKTTLVQGNFGQQTRWSGNSIFTRLNTYLRLSQSQNTDTGHLIIWPETVLNATGRNDNELFSHIISQMGQQNILIAGGTRRDRRRQGFFNSAYIVSGDGTIQWYDKTILLPYAESILLNSILGQYYNAPNHFLAGRSLASFNTGSGRAGISICFEVLYPWYIRKSVESGAQFLVNISNDQWFGDTTEPVTHFYSNIFRAVENRRFLLRASNSGLSAIISPTGTVLTQTGLFRREAIYGEFVPLDEITLYTRFGDWILYLSLLVLIGDLVRKILKD